MSLCPICDTEVDVDQFDVDRDDELSCPECGVNLVVIAVSPVQLEASSLANDASDTYFEEAPEE
tara:strand:+ start:357 stop:548 length:192 start_codon:yes stop_codon:yes gene_type:complete